MSHVCRAGRTVVEIVAAQFQVLSIDRGQHRPVLVHLVQQAPPHGSELFGIDVGRDALYRPRKHVAAYRAVIRREGIDDDAVDPAAAVGVGGDEAQCELLADWNVDHEAAAAVAAASFRVGQRPLHRSIPGAKLGLIRNDFDCAAHRARTV